MKLLFDELVSTWTGGGLSLPLCRPHWESDEFAQYTPDARATMLIVCQTTRNYHPSDIYPRCINDSYVYRCYTPVKIALDGPAVVCSSYLNTQPSIFSISDLSRSALIFSRGFERIPRNLSRFKVSQVAAILRSLPFDSHRWRRLQGPLLAGLRERGILPVPQWKLNRKHRGNCPLISEPRSYHKALLTTLPHATWLLWDFRGLR